MNTIIHPSTKQVFNLYSKQGKQLLKKFIFSYNHLKKMGGSEGDEWLDASEQDGTLMRIGSYELTQSRAPDPTCFIKDNYSVKQLQDFLHVNLIPYLQNMKSNPFDFELNVIGSPSENAIVFKLKFNGVTINQERVIQCYALKIMPKIEGTDNELELFFAEYLSNLNPDFFALMYYNNKIDFNLEDIRFSLKEEEEEDMGAEGGEEDEEEDTEAVPEPKTQSIFKLKIRDWYDPTKTPSEKVKKHMELYKKIINFNQSEDQSEEQFSCDILVSRMYWGDMLAFSGQYLEEERKKQPMVTQSLSESVSKKCPQSNELIRCEQKDFFGKLIKIKTNVPEMKILLSKILNRIYFLRDHNIIHNDLHCGNILLDFNGEPIIHDFGLTLLYEPPKDEAQLYAGDIKDFCKFIFSLRLEVNNNYYNKDVTYYLKNVCETLDKKFEEYRRLGYTQVPKPLDKSKIIRYRKTTGVSEINDKLKRLRSALFRELYDIIFADYVEEEFNLVKLLSDGGIKPDDYVKFTGKVKKGEKKGKIITLSEILMQTQASKEGLEDFTALKGAFLRAKPMKNKLYKDILEKWQRHLDKQLKDR